MNGSGLRPSLVILTGIIAGLILGFLYTWFYIPVQTALIAPGGLPAEQKNSYRALVAMAYSANGDRTQAEARLRLLDEERLPVVMDSQAQNALQAGREREAQALAGLAAALRTPIDASGTVSSPQPTQAPAQARPVRSTPTPLPPFLPRVTSTPPATRGVVFALSSSDPVCDPALPEGLLQVYVVDANGDQAAGVRVNVTWDGGQTDVFYTGLAPDMGPGYADFRMSPQIIYTITVGDVGEPAGDLVAPVCERPDGSNYMGGIRTRFQP